MLRSVSSSVSKRLLMSLFSTTLTIATHLCWPPIDTLFLSPVSLAVRLISRLPRYSLIATLITDVLHWLPVTCDIDYTVLLLVSHAQKGQAPKCLFGLMRKPLSFLSSSPLRSAQCVNYLLVPQTIRLSRSKIVPLRWLAL